MIKDTKRASNVAVGEKLPPLERRFTAVELVATNRETLVYQPL